MPVVARRDPDETTTSDARAGKRSGRGSTVVYEDLREDILSLRIAPGSVLDEVALANRFGLSRTPIREALVMLSGEQLVAFLPSRSAIVAPHTMENASEYLDALVLHARAVCRLAAQQRTRRAMEQIRLRHRLYQEAANDPRDVSRMVAADLAFHNSIAEAGRNQFLCNFYGQSLDYGRRMLLLHYYPGFGRTEAAETIADHSALAEAIDAPDGDRAEELATQHIHSFVKVIQQSLEPKLLPTASRGLGFALREHRL